MEFLYTTAGQIQCNLLMETTPKRNTHYGKSINPSVIIAAVGAAIRIISVRVALFVALIGASLYGTTPHSSHLSSQGVLVWLGNFIFRTSFLSSKRRNIFNSELRKKL
jgi:hypothetical protein